MGGERLGWFATLGFMPLPEERVLVTSSNIFASVLPVHLFVYLCYYAMAVLVVVPNTQQYRLSLLPIALFGTFQAATHFDLSGGNPRMNFVNFGQCLSMMSISMRMIDWSFLREPLQRSRKEENTNIFVNALNLMFNFRGYGWTWADRTYCPPETRPINSRGKYTFDTFLWFITSLIFFDAFNYAVIGLSPPGVGTPSGDSIFDASLPLFPRYAMSTLITLLYGGVFYFSLEMVYYFANFVACLLPHFNASDWPPLSEAPWRATSLARFWGKHWHQSYHRSFIALAKPLRALFGREGSIMGAFLISAILHDWCIWGMGKGTNFTQTGGFFVLMGLGIILEHMWEWITSKKAGGVWGWIWTATWLLGCGNLVVDAWMKTGLGGGDLLPPNARPAKAALDYVFRAMQ